MNIVIVRNHISIPQAYYTYNDTTCKFPCQAIEYWWWSTAAYTGLIKNRSEVKKEFKYYLLEDFKAKDPKMYALITVSCNVNPYNLTKQNFV